MPRKTLQQSTDDEIENFMFYLLAKGVHVTPEGHRRCEVADEHRKRFPRQYTRKGKPIRP